MSGEARSTTNRGIQISFEREGRRRAFGVKRESRKLSFVLYELLYGPIVFIQAVYRQLLVLLLMFSLGAGIFYYFEGLAPLDALLASVSTITTIGLYVPHGGNFGSMPTPEAALLILLILVSVGAGASILQSTVNSAVNGDLARGAVERKLIAKLKHHAIVYGYTDIGKYVAKKLEEMGCDYVVVTDDKAQHEKLVSQHGLAVLQQDKETIDAFKQARIEKASAVIVCLADDSDIMLAVLSARKLRPDIRIVSAIHNANHIESAKNAGADNVVSTSATVGHLLAFSAMSTDLVGVIFPTGVDAQEISEIPVPAGSPLVGHPLASQTLSDLAVIGLVRSGRVYGGQSDSSLRIQAGDSLLAMGDTSKLQRMESQAKQAQTDDDDKRLSANENGSGKAD